jgi:hypothetical protein
MTCPRSGKSVTHRAVLLSFSLSLTARRYILAVKMRSWLALSPALAAATALALPSQLTFSASSASTPLDLGTVLKDAWHGVQHSQPIGWAEQGVREFSHRVQESGISCTFLPPSGCPTHSDAAASHLCVSSDSNNETDPPTRIDELIQHADFPAHSLRMKEPKGLCDSSSKSYSGYLDIAEDAHLFYWFFESRSKHPEQDPLVLWINGGPGVSFERFLGWPLLARTVIDPQRGTPTVLVDHRSLVRARPLRRRQRRSQHDLQPALVDRIRQRHLPRLARPGRL